MALVVYTDTEDLDPTVGIAMLEEAGHRVVRLETRDPEQILAAATNAEGLLVGYAPIGADLIQRLPRLEIISLLSTGADNVDVETASTHGICVANIGGAAAFDVATHALALTLAAVRGLPIYLEAAQRDGWFATPYQHVPRRTSELRFGILGLGRIGATLARLAAPLFAEVCFYDHHVKLPPDDVSATPLTFDELVATSDVLVLTLPATAETAGLVGGAFLERMPAEAVLVNVSRGILVDSPSLARAVAIGHLSAAALDVLDEEPPKPNHPLLGEPRIVLTPHVGFLSDVSMRDYVVLQAQNVIRWFAGEHVPTTINSIGQRS